MAVWAGRFALRCVRWGRIPARISLAMLCIALSFGLAAKGLAIPPFLKVLKATYNFAPGSDADKAGCKNCHTSPPQRNPFGKDVEAALDAANASMLTPAILKTIESKDSDGDGVSNGVELAAGSNPGDASSVPPKPTAGKTSAGSAASAPLIPLHTYHPAIVHFPIALFMFGVLLEVLGYRGGNEAMRQAGYWNLLGSVIALAVVVPTGLIACFRQGFSLTPGQPVFTHFLLAVLATVTMIVSLIWRRRAAIESRAYFALLVVACAFLFFAGHYGGNLVY